jgi:putative tryptophan/tyrosine transport system substrate-binding protein
VIGYLGLTTEENQAALLDAFRKGLSESGYVEGQDVTIEHRWAERQLQALADEVIE